MTKNNYGGLKKTDDQTGLTHWDAGPTQKMLNVFLETNRRQDPKNSLNLPEQNLRSEGLISNGRLGPEASVTATHDVLRKYLAAHLGSRFQQQELTFSDGAQAHQHRVAANTVRNMQRLLGFVDPHELGLSHQDMQLIRQTGAAPAGPGQTPTQDGLSELKHRLAQNLAAHPQYGNADKVIADIQQHHVVDGRFGKASKEAWADFAKQGGKGYRLASSMPDASLTASVTPVTSSPLPPASLVAAPAAATPVPAQSLAAMKTAAAAAAPSPSADDRMRKFANDLRDKAGMDISYDGKDFQVQVPAGRGGMHNGTRVDSPRELDPQSYRDSFVAAMQKHYVGKTQGQTPLTAEAASKIGLPQKNGEHYSFTIPQDSFAKSDIADILNDQVATKNLNSTIQNLKMTTASPPSMAQKVNKIATDYFSAPVM